MKTPAKQHENKDASRAVAHTGASASRGFPAVSPFPVQRSAISIDEEEIEGSSDEIDVTEFWKKFYEKYKDIEFYTTLKRLINEIKIKKMKEQASEWDLKILFMAENNFSSELKYEKFDEVDEEKGKKIVEVLLPVKGNSSKEDQPIGEKEIDKQACGWLIKALGTYAKSVKSQDKPEVSLNGETNPYQLLLKRAVEEILYDYGVQMMHSGTLPGKDDQALTNLTTANVHHATERVDNASKEEFEDAQKQATLWVMSNDLKTKETILTIQEKIHPGSSFATICSAYTKALTESGKEENGTAEILKQLANIRLSWGPITYGPKIYLQVTTAKPNVDDQWWFFETLIHEAIHSAEHAGFAKFLEQHIPEGLRSDIREGVVEYLTRKIWKRVLETTEEGKTKKDTSPAGSSEKLVASKTQLEKLRKKREDPEREYKSQVDRIEEIISILDKGDERLEQAYFYGNLGVLLPKIN